MTEIQKLSMEFHHSLINYFPSFSMEYLGTGRYYFFTYGCPFTQWI